MPDQAIYPFRTFVSYAHADMPIIERIVAKLESFGLSPLWDDQIKQGKPFADEIKDLIARSHLFLPIITSHSNTRPWVHQETGFAIALDIPILPICIGQTPSEMIADVQAITVKDDLSNLIEQLSKIDLINLVTPRPQKPFSSIVIADTPEQRGQLRLDHANWVVELGEYGVVRAQARFTIFAVPNSPADDPIWDKREGDAKRSHYLRDIHRQERNTIERHARMAGCRLIINPSAPTFDIQGSQAQKIRQQLLLDFLKSMPSDKLDVAISPQAQDRNLTMIGDYFFAESMAARPGGYFQTVFNSHPPTVLRRIQQFEQLFEESQTQNPMSLDEVIGYVEGLLQ